MVTRRRSECDCGWRSPTVDTATEAQRLGRKHRWACDLVTDADLLELAKILVYGMWKFRRDHQDAEDYIQVAALAGIHARATWRPGQVSCNTHVFEIQKLRLIDHLRTVNGRRKAGPDDPRGWKQALDAAVICLDAPVSRDSETPWHALQADPGWAIPFEDVEDRAMVASLLAGLSGRDREILIDLANEVELRATGARWGVSESRACQIRQRALLKARALT